MGFTAKVQLTDVREHGEGDHRQAALSFSPDYRDGRNADWAAATPALSLQMTVRADLVERLGLRSGQEFTLTFDRDGGEQGIVSPDVQTEDEAEDVEVPDPETGETKLVTRTEATRLGYDVGNGGVQGVAAPVGVAPEAPREPVDAEPVEDDADATRYDDQHRAAE